MIQYPAVSQHSVAADHPLQMSCLAASNYNSKLKLAPICIGAQRRPVTLTQFVAPSVILQILPCLKLLVNDVSRHCIQNKHYKNTTIAGLRIPCFLIEFLDPEHYKQYI